MVQYWHITFKACQGKRLDGPLRLSRDQSLAKERPQATCNRVANSPVTSVDFDVVVLHANEA